MLTFSSPIFAGLLRDPGLSDISRQCLRDLQPLLLSLHPAKEMDTCNGRLVCSDSWYAIDPQSPRGRAVRQLLAGILQRVSLLPELKQDPCSGTALALRASLLRLCYQVSRLPEGLWERDDLLGSKEAGRPLRSYLIGPELLPRDEEGARLVRIWNKVKFARVTGLGGLCPAHQGANGTQFALKTGKRLCGVYKPSWKQTPFVERVVNVVKAWTGGQLSKLPYGPVKQPQAECAAYHIDRYFGYNIMPATMMLSDGACFQLSLFKHLKHKHGLASSRDMLAIRGDAIGDILDRTHYQASELHPWQAYCAHDYLVGDLDAHPENFYLLISRDGKILDVVALDKANSFPVEDVEEGCIADAHRYLWGSDYRVSTCKFLEPARKLMRESARDIRNAVSELKQSPELKGFFEPALVQRLLLRAAVLGQAADDPFMTPALLSELRSHDQMWDYLSPYSSDSEDEVYDNPADLLNIGILKI